MKPSYVKLGTILVGAGLNVYSITMRFLNQPTISGNSNPAMTKDANQQWEITAVVLANIEFGWLGLSVLYILYLFVRVSCLPAKAGVYAR